jgi:hypothetical protein
MNFIIIFKNPTQGKTAVTECRIQEEGSQEFHMSLNIYEENYGATVCNIDGKLNDKDYYNEVIIKTIDSHPPQSGGGSLAMRSLAEIAAHCNRSRLRIVGGSGADPKGVDTIRFVWAVWGFRQCPQVRKIVSDSFQEIASDQAREYVDLMYPIYINHQYSPLTLQTRRFAEENKFKEIHEYYINRNTHEYVADLNTVLSKCHQKTSQFALMKMDRY